MEAYRVGIAIALSGNASSFLGLMVRDLNHADAAAVKLKATLRDIKLLSLAGAGVGIAGALGLNALKDTLKPAREYAHELALMNQNVRSHAEAAKMVAAAWQTSREVLTTTPTQNLRAAQELRQVFGAGPEGLKELTAALPIVQKIDAILGSFTGKFGESGGAYTIAKALEMVNATRNAGDFEYQADLMTKAIEASRARVMPQDFLSAFKYGRTATAGWDDRFKYQILPTLIQELKNQGGSGGTAGGPGNPLMSAFASIVGGQMATRSAQTFLDLGLVDRSKLIYTKTGALKGVKPDAIKGWDVFERDPFEWEQSFLHAALQRQGYSPEKIKQVMAYLFPNRSAGFIMSQMELAPWKFTRDVPLYASAQGLAGYRQMMNDNPEMAFASAEAQWTKLKTVIGNELIPIVIPAIRKLADVLDELSAWGRGNPAMLHDLVVGFGLLSGTLAFSGTVMSLYAAFKALKTVLYDLPAALAVARGGAAAAGAGNGAAAAGAGAAARGLGLGAGSLVAGAGIVAGGLYYFRDEFKKWSQSFSSDNGHWDSIGNRPVWRPWSASGLPATTPASGHWGRVGNRPVWRTDPGYGVGGALDLGGRGLMTPTPLKGISDDLKTFGGAADDVLKGMRPLNRSLGEAGPAAQGAAAGLARLDAMLGKLEGAINNFSTRPIDLHSTVKINDRELGRAVTRHVERAAASWPNDRDGFDAGQMAPSAGSGNYYPT